MTILTSSPLAPLLDRLSADSDVTKRIVMERFGALSGEERTSMMRDNPRALYAMASDIHLAVSPGTGKLLYLLARAIAARSIVEFGASFGFSTLHLAAALHDMGAGRLISSEFEPSKVAHARDNLSHAGLLELVDLREGDALETLATDLPAVVDLLFLDGANPHYLPVLAMVERRLRPGAIVVADNAGGSPDFLDHVRNSGSYMSTALDDVELSFRL